MNERLMLKNLLSEFRKIEKNLDFLSNDDWEGEPTVQFLKRCASVSLELCQSFMRATDIIEYGGAGDDWYAQCERLLDEEE